MRILLVSAQYPEDLSFGGGQRTALMHRALRQVGDVTMLVMREGQALQSKARPAPGVLAEIGYPEPTLRRKYQREPVLEPLLRDLLDLDEFDFVVGRYLGPLLALPAFRGRSVVDADDAYYRYPGGHRVASGVLAALKTQARTQLGQRALQRVDHAWFCCDRDRQRFELSASSVLPNVATCSETPVESVRDTAPMVLMVGSLWYGPNREALERFLHRCWPWIRREMPEARFRAVGAAPPEQRSLWERHPGVECPGFVDDLVAEYRQARVTVVPVRSGGGTQIKALESLAHGRAPVVSSFVAAGFAPHLRHGESLLVADSDADMAQRVLDLLINPQPAEPLVERGRRVVGEFFSRERFEGVVRASLASLRPAPWSA